MLCPHCSSPIPTARVAELLSWPVEELMLLLCGKCDYISLLEGGRLVDLTWERIDAMSELEVDAMLEATCVLRSHAMGVEGALELVEKTKAEIEKRHAPKPT